MAGLIDAVIGHDETWQRLLRQHQLGRMPHAMAFCGPAGIGKKRVGWALAQVLVCDAAQPPCGQCAPCLRIVRQQSESLLFLEPENSVLKLESTQRVLAFLNLRLLGRARVVLIDDAQTLNAQAANALLKIIEEPPEQTFFILLVSELSQLLPTLRSRVQVVRFAPVAEALLRTHAPQTLPDWMVRSARGSFQQLEKFADSEDEELRGLILAFLTGSLQRRRIELETLLDRTKDRALAQKAAQFLQQLLRDWSLLEGGDLIHTDLAAQLSALPRVDGRLRLELWRLAFRLEQDLAAHVDRVLLFENFFYHLRSAVG